MQLGELYNVQQDLDEGRYDQHIFKALFMAGGPGAGKSYIAKNIRGATGLKYINIDSFVEMFGKKQQIEPANIYKDPQLHGRAKELRNKRQMLGVQGRLGLLIDTTSRNLEKTKTAKNQLEELGYDTAMLYVNTDIETAIERNEKRERRVPADFLVQAHNQSKRNLHAYDDMFSPLFILDNSNPTDEEMSKALRDQQEKVWRGLQRWLNKPNPAAEKFRQRD